MRFGLYIFAILDIVCYNTQMTELQQRTVFERFFYDGGREPLYKSDEFAVAVWPDGMPKLDLQAVVASRDRYPDGISKFAALPFKQRLTLHEVADTVANKSLGAIHKVLQDRKILPVHDARIVKVEDGTAVNDHQLLSGFGVFHPHIVVAPADRGFFANMWSDQSMISDSARSGAMEQTIEYMKLGGEEINALEGRLRAIGSLGIPRELELPRL